MKNKEGKKDKWTATFNPYLNEWAVERNGEIFCHLCDSDFFIFEVSFVHTIERIGYDQNFPKIS